MNEWSHLLYDLASIARNTSEKSPHTKEGKKKQTSELNGRKNATKYLNLRFRYCDYLYLNTTNE